MRRLFKRPEAKTAKRPKAKTAIQVYLYIYEFLEGFDGRKGWEEFISQKIEDPHLDSIRAKASLVELPADKWGLITLRGLLAEMETLIGKTEQHAEPAMGEFQYIHLPPNSSPKALISQQPFSAVVIITAEITSEWRDIVSEWLVKEGCLCMMAWGSDCSLWDESVDVANLEAHNWEGVPDDRLVMTTWHDDDPLSDVFWDANLSIFHPPDSSFDHLVILDIADNEREHQMRGLFAKACNKVD